MSEECPKCHLPKDDSAWQCDGCGYEFSKDYEAVRADLGAKLASARTAVWLTLLLGLAITGGIVYLATRGWIYISIPLALAVIGWVGHAVHRVSVLRGHLSSLDRRHVPLPKASVHSDH
jgi:hypothetical protein